MNCKNCNQTLSPNDKFCSKCGGKIVDEVISYAYVANDFSNRFLNIENNLIARTFKDMFLDPKKVIDGYINGVRKRHLNFANYLALALSISGVQLFLMKKFFEDNMDLSWMVSTDNPAANMEGNSFMNAMFEYQGLVYLLIIPIYAIISKIIFLNKKKYTYLHHNIIAGYTQSHLSVFLFAPTILCLALGMNFFKLSYFGAYPIMIFYFAYVYKRVFQLSLKQIILKTILFLVLGVVIYVGIILLAFFIMVATGAVDLQDFAPKKEAVNAVGYIASSVANWTS